MFDTCQHPAALKALYDHALGRAFLRYRNPKRRASGRHLGEFYERVWREAAERLGAEFVPLGAGIAEIRLDGRTARVFENSCSIDDPVTLALAGNKAVTYRLLREAGLPTPPHAAFSFKTIGAAVAFLGSVGGNCVVKPAADTGGGRGVTTGVRTRNHLARAAGVASVYGDDLLIEGQQAGENYRLLYLDGRLLDAFARNPPTVVADGRSTVAQPVREANDARLRYGSGISQVLLTVDLDMKRTLAGRGLTLSSTPAEGTLVTVKTVVNENCGADNTTATHRLCPEIVDAGARAARATRGPARGDRPDHPRPGRPAGSVGGTVLEVNTPPNYYYNYHKRDGSFAVALPVLERLLLGGPPPASLPPGRPTSAPRGLSLMTGTRPADRPAPDAAKIGARPRSSSSAAAANAVSVARGRSGGSGPTSTPGRAGRVRRPVPGTAGGSASRPSPPATRPAHGPTSSSARRRAAPRRGAPLLLRRRHRTDRRAPRRALAGRYLLDDSNPRAQLRMLNKLETYHDADGAGVPTPLLARRLGARRDRRPRRPHVSA